MDTTYKFTVNEDDTVTFVASADGIEQNLSGRDTSSQAALQADLDTYAKAYVEGLQLVQAPAVGKDIQVAQELQADYAKPDVVATPAQKVATPPISAQGA